MPRALKPWSLMPRLALAAAALAFTALLTAAAPKPRPMEAKPPPPANLTPPADEVVMAGACLVGKDQCVDYEGFAAAEAQARCKKQKGTFQAEACRAEGRVGTCTVRETGTDNRVLTRWYPPATEKSARAECKKAARGVYLAK